VFRHRRRLVMVETDMSVMFFDHRLDRSPSTSQLRLATLAGNRPTLSVFRATLFLMTWRVSLAEDPSY
jgi:hypothetical protein